jgi:uncharacterized membrane protein
MGILEIVLVLSALLCALVAGFLFAFAFVVMPGIQELNDRNFLTAFQVMDRVIQRNQPCFITVWVGSAAAVASATLLSFWHLVGIDHLLLMSVGAIYLIGVQLPSATVNIPLNNRIQKLDVDSLSKSDVSQERNRFEGQWNKWNRIRTICAALALILLITLILKL